jgi:hypothetical protein
MKRLAWFGRVFLVAAMLVKCSVPAAADVSIRPGESWCGVFGQSEQVFSFSIEDRERAADRLVWRFSAANRTIARGQVPLDGVANRVAIRLDIPPVRDGVVFPAELALEVLGPDDAPLAHHVRPLWIFPRDPFAGRTAWLVEQQIAVFDPSGGTRDVLAQAGVPLREIRQVSAIGQVQEGLLLVGEGVSFQAHRGLADALLGRAESGVPVLCLAPADGFWPVPGPQEQAGREGGNPTSLIWKRAEVIRELDKRLDATGWPPDGQLVASGLRLTSVRGQVMAEVLREGDVWPWYEVRYPGHRASCIVCGFGIVAHWQAGPAPRFLLARILEYLANQGGLA